MQERRLATVYRHHDERISCCVRWRTLRRHAERAARTEVVHRNDRKRVLRSHCRHQEAGPAARPGAFPRPHLPAAERPLSHGGQSWINLTRECGSDAGRNCVRDGLRREVQHSCDIGMAEGSDVRWAGSEEA